MNTIKKLILFITFSSLIGFTAVTAQEKNQLQKPLKQGKDFFDYFDYDPSNYRPLDLKPYMFIDKRGKANLAGGIYYDKSLDRFLIFSESFLKSNTNLFISNKLQVHSIEDLRGLTIGVRKGNFAESYLYKKYPFLKIKTFPDQESVVRSAADGEIAAFVQDYPSAAFFLNKYEAYGQFENYSLFENSQSQDELNGSSALSKMIREEIEKQEEKKKNEKKASFFKENWKWFVFIFALFCSFILYVLWLHKKLKNKSKHRFPLDLSQWQAILLEGESDFVEFKSSLRWDYRESRSNKDLEAVIAKTIGAFLNSRGGVLFIGVDDNGKPIGLENDMKTLGKRQQNTDGFLLQLTAVINQYLGKEFHRSIETNIQEVEEKQIVMVKIEPSDSPCFVQYKNKEEFYIRASASSQPLGLKDSHQYIRSRWG